MSDFKGRMHQIPLDQLTALPRPLAALKGPTSKGRGREKREWREGREPLLFCRSMPMAIVVVFSSRPMSLCSLSVCLCIVKLCKLNISETDL